MTPKDPFLEGTFWDKFWRPIRSRALLFTPDISFSENQKGTAGRGQKKKSRQFATKVTTISLRA